MSHAKTVPYRTCVFGVIEIGQPFVYKTRHRALLASSNTMHGRLPPTENSCFWPSTSLLLVPQTDPWTKKEETIQQELIKKQNELGPSFTDFRASHEDLEGKNTLEEFI
jgi:hypothetical protein